VILSCYLAGANSRRVKKALAPLLGEKHLSKSAVSRVVGRLKELFAVWLARDLSGGSHPILFLDGFNLKVRMARRVVSVPVLAVLGVRDSGEKVLLSLRLAPSEASANWSAVIVDPSVDTSKPVISRRVKTGHFRPGTETGEFYSLVASVRKSVWILVRQLRGPDLRTWAWWSNRSRSAVTAAVSPRSLPQSSTGRFEVSSVEARS